MEYIDILSTALYWYALVGVALLAGSVVVYAAAVFLYRLLVGLGTAIGHMLEHTAQRVADWSHHHHAAR